ncbi:MAG TPA: hypothetical protein DIU35_11195 [Candidatus Latescibacteria bacterium]|nr:hypothetical protein [Gemmatimonadota bacterium]HCR18038.1 hypothetical protein [Candidatus Latescibacterota bacterium]
MAIDKFSPKTKLYRRVYVGGRLLNNDREGAHPLFNGIKELQIGGDLFIRGPLGCQRFDHLVFGGEIYWRAQLAHASPQLVPSINLVTGIILGRYFKQYILDMDCKKGTKLRRRCPGKKLSPFF